MSERILDLVDRLRGKYVLAVNDGAGPLNGKDTFAREFQTPPIQHEAAAEIERLRDEVARLNRLSTQMILSWDRWQGTLDGRVIFWTKHLFHWRGWRIDLHKFVGADDAMCFHSHPAWAFRVVLWGGYEEEKYRRTFRRFFPGRFGVVSPHYCHRIHRLFGRVSYSLWLRAPVSHDIYLLGRGWPVQMIGRQRRDA